mgnify:CR=1 FL=1
MDCACLACISTLYITISSLSLPLSMQSIPVWWRWYFWGDPVAWSIYGLVASQLGDVTTPINNPDFVGEQQSVKVYLEQNFGYEHNFLGVVAAVHVGLALMFVFVFAYGIKKFNFLKR